MDKKTLVLVIAALIIGGLVGYYFGYDIGYEAYLNNNKCNVPEAALC